MEGSVELSRREREVAGLVAEGLTNREIAKRLFIAERTAEGHVERIRNKLGFSSRSQIAAWYVAHHQPAGAAVVQPGAAGSPGGIVVFLLTDLQGSTRSWERNPSAMREAMMKHDAILRGCIERQGGNQVESGREGDSILAAFPNAPSAARSAIEIQREINDATWPHEIELKIRIAVHAGEAQLRGGHYFGQALNRCARLLATCHPGQIVLSQAAHELLADELPAESEVWDLGLHRLRDVERPEHVFQLTDVEHPARFPPLHSIAYDRSNLPAQVTSFVGREDELRELKELERHERLLTLVGPGGCGKTRLAQELAAGLIGNGHPDGVWFADLTPVVDPNLVPNAVAAALELQEQIGRPPLETAVEYCRRRRLLLVLDNCEHVIETAARLTFELISSCPDVHVVATSREPLRIPGETVWRVNPLRVDDATRLFLDRARSSAPSFALPESGMTVVSQICERLDGIPLAMELAAARVAFMPVDEIAERLESGLALLSGGSRTAAARQQTLRATMDWSFNLLAPPEQRLFRRLAVFPSTFSLEACEVICSDSTVPAHDIVDLLGQLVSKSMVVTSNGNYRLLDTIRAYALDQLQAADEMESMQSRHAACYMRLAASRRPGTLAIWLDRLEADQDNVHAALRWATNSDPVMGARIADNLFAYWLYRARITEARSMLADLLATLEADHEMAGHLLMQAGALAYVAGDQDVAAGQLRLGVERARSHGDDPAVAQGLLYIGVLDTARNRLDEAHQVLDEALEVSRRTENREQEGEVLHQLGVVESSRGNIEGARALLQQSLDTRRRAGRPDEAGMTLVFLSAATLMSGDPASAYRFINEALQIGLALRDRRSAWSLGVLACISGAQGDHARAIRLAGSAAAMFETTGQKPPEAWQGFLSAFLTPAREALGAEEERAAWEEGHAMQFEAALDYALRRGEPVSEITA